MWPPELGVGVDAAVGSDWTTRDSTAYGEGDTMYIHFFRDSTNSLLDKMLYLTLEIWAYFQEKTMDLLYYLYVPW